MASAFGHFIFGAGMAVPFACSPAVKKIIRPAGLVVWSGLLAVSPDLDLIFWGAIPYKNFLGHRGFFHSPFFAIVTGLMLSVLVAILLRRISFDAWWRVSVVFIVSLTSHGLIDAMTDGGLGVMLLFPFSEERLFLPWRPIHVSPILSTGLMSGRLWEILISELWLMGAGLTAPMVVAVRSALAGRRFSGRHS